MQPTTTTTAAPTAASVSPTKIDNNNYVDDWIAGWITPTSESEGGGSSSSPSGSLSSVPTLSEFGSFDNCCSGNNTNISNNYRNTSSPGGSLDVNLDWCHLGSMESNESREEDHEYDNDQVHPLHPSSNGSKAPVPSR